jgi:alpha-tubulin suppressor-like RCC1 family protein
MRCWGRNEFGELGHASATAGDRSDCGLGNEEVCNSTDSIVPGVVNARGIAIGSSRACAITADYGVSCWGFNPDHPATPQAITTSGLTPIGGVRKVVAYGDTFCAATYSQGVWCWGEGARGQLANGAYTSWAFTASQFGGLAGAEDVAIGTSHVCVLVGGEVRCAGAFADGQLGDGTHQDGSDGCATGCSATPRAVTGLSNVVQLAASTRSTCALTDAGDVYCWGGNGAGALGHAAGTSGDVIVHGYPLNATAQLVVMP